MKKSHIFIILALISFIILRLPSLFEPHWYGDEGVYASVAYSLESGKTLYTQVWDNKPPAIYWLYSAAGQENRLLLVRLTSLIAGAFTILLLYKLSIMLKFGPRARMLSTTVAIFLLGTPILEGNIANAENFFVPLILISFILILKQTRPKALINGLLVGVALLFKFHPVFDMLAIIVFLTLAPWENLKEKLLYFSTFFAGLSIPLLSTLFYFVYSHNFSAAMQAIFKSNIGYSTTYNTIFFESYIKFGIAIVSIILLTFFYRQKKLSVPAYFIGLVLTFEAYGAILSGRRYHHYLLQTIPALSLYAGLLLFFMLSKKPLLNRLAVFFVSTVTFSTFLVFFYLGEGTVVNTNPLRYYKNYYNYISSHERQYFLNNADLKIATVEKSLQKYHTHSVYFHSNLAWLYDRLKIVPPTRFVVAYHQFLIPDGESLLLSDLERWKPTIFALDREETLTEQLSDFVKQYYQMDSDDDYFIYYRKRASNQLST